MIATPPVEPGRAKASELIIKPGWCGPTFKRARLAESHLWTTGQAQHSCLPIISIISLSKAAGFVMPSPHTCDNKYWTNVHHHYSLTFSPSFLGPYPLPKHFPFLFLCLLCKCIDYISDFCFFQTGFSVCSPGCLGSQRILLPLPPLCWVLKVCATTPGCFI